MTKKKNRNPEPMSDLFQELKRCKVFRVGAAYAIVGRMQALK